MPAPIGTNDQFPDSSEKITLKKSTYHTLIGGLVASIVIAIFLGGYAIGDFDDDSNLKIAEDSLGTSETESISNGGISQAETDESMVTGTNIIQLSIHDDPVKGDPDAPVTMIEFSDFQCPFCYRFTSQTLPLIEENYIETGKVKLVYKDLPLRIHSNARAAHIAAECADEQGNFWGYHDILFLQQNQWQTQTSSNLDVVLTNFATGLGMNRTAFQECMKSPETAGEVQLDTLEAASNDANGTPTFFIGDEKNGFVKIVGAQPYSVFQRIIDDKLGS